MNTFAVATLDSPSPGGSASASLAARERVSTDQKRKFDDDGSNDPLVLSDLATKENETAASELAFSDPNETSKERPLKRVKQCYTNNLSDLPFEVLSLIFEFCQPKALGRLMCVCKWFHMILKSDQSVLLFCLSQLSQIWKIVRQLRYPGLETFLPRNTGSVDRKSSISSKSALPLDYTEQQVMALMGLFISRYPHYSWKFVLDLQVA